MLARIVITAIIAAAVVGGLSGLLFWAVSDDADLVVLGALATGSVVGLAFAGIGALTASGHRKMEVTTGHWDGEPLLRQGPANYFIHGDEADSWLRAYYKGEGLGGWLVLTKTRIIIRTHWGAYRRDPLVISRADVEEVSARRGTTKMQNRLTLRLTSDRLETFIVDDPEDWESALGEHASDVHL